MAETTQEQQKPEPLANCPVCNKHLSRRKRYYRNGKYYCGKPCWKKVSKEEEKIRKEKAAKKQGEKKTKLEVQQPEETKKTEDVKVESKKEEVKQPQETKKPEEKSGS